MGMGMGREWGKTRLNMGLGMGMKMNRWELERIGLKKTFWLISNYMHCAHTPPRTILTVSALCV